MWGVRGREAVDAVRAAWATTSGAGTGGLVVVTGPPGVGRSHVLDAAAAAVGAGTSASATARPPERGVGLGLVRRLLAPLVEREPGLLVGATSAWAGPLFGVGGEGDAAAVAHGVVTLVERLGERGPVLLVVDDLHRADVESLRVVGDLVERCRALPVLVLASRVDGVPGRADLDAVGARADVVRLARLTDDEVGSVVAGALGRRADPGFVAAVSEATGGLPALLAPLVEALRTAGLTGRGSDVAALGRIAVPAVPAVVAARLAELPLAAAGLARAAAVVGPEVRADVLAAAAELPPGDLGPLIALLVDAHLFRPGPRPAWTSSLLQRAVAESVGAGTAALARVRAAAAMDRAGDPAEDVAVLLLDGPPVGEGWAARVLRDAAVAADGRGAPVAAGRLWARLLEEPLARDDRGWAVAGLARTELQLGDPAGVPRLQGLAPVVDDPGLRARIHIAAARGLLWAGSAVAAVGEFRAATVAADAAGDGLVAGRGRTGELLALAIAADPAHPVGAAAAGPVPSVAPTDASFLAARALAGALAGAPAAVVEADALAGVAPAALYGGAVSDNTALSAGALALVAVGRASDAVAALDRLIRAAHEAGALSTVATVEAVRATALVAAGRLDEALAAAEVGSGDRHAYPVERSAAAAVVAECRRRRGDLDGAAAALDAVGLSAPPAPGAGPPRLGELRALAALAALALDRGDLDGALAAADAVAAAPVAAGVVGAEAVAVLALARSGREVEARRRAAALVAAEADQAPSRLGRARVVAAVAEGDVDGLAAAVDLLGVGSDPLARIDGLLALGHARSRVGRRVVAREAFREALAVADEVGALAAAADAAEGLRLAGGRPRRRAVRGVAALTPAEERVCRLVAAGASNREVAETLFLSRKTVEFHLGNAYAKLAVARREDLAAVLRPPDPSPTPDPRRPPSGERGVGRH